LVRFCLKTPHCDSDVDADVAFNVDDKFPIKIVAPFLTTKFETRILRHT